MRHPMRTACGITGIVVNTATLDIADLLAVLHTIQHRGQSSWGVASLQDDEITGQTQVGLLPDKSLTFTPRPLACCIGHVGESVIARGESCNGMDGTQPVLGKSPRGMFAVAFNGRLGHFDDDDNTTPAISDIQRIVGAIAGHPSDTWVKVLHDVVANCVAAFTLVLLTDQGLFYARDLRGYRPLVWADISVIHPETGQRMLRCQMVVSEDCGHLELRRRLVARYPKLIVETKPHTVQPGTIGHIMLNGRWKEWAVRLNIQGKQHIEPGMRCSLEAIHFMDSSGEFDGLDLKRFREICGRELAAIDRVNRDIFPAGSTIVMGCPRSGILCGKGYAAAARLPYAQLIRAVNKVSRTSITPTTSSPLVNDGDPGKGSACASPRYRHRKRKQRPHLVLGHDTDIAGKTIVVVDDILITGNTIQKVIKLLRSAHAAEIHVRIATPAVHANCRWGAVLPDIEDLFASPPSSTNPLTISNLGISSLKYLSPKRFGQLTGPGYCQECFLTADAPTAGPAGRAPSPGRTRGHTTISLPDST